MWGYSKRTRAYYYVKNNKYKHGILLCEDGFYRIYIKNYIRREFCLQIQYKSLYDCQKACFEGA